MFKLSGFSLLLVYYHNQNTDIEKDSSKWLLNRVDVTTDYIKQPNERVIIVLLIEKEYHTFVYCWL